MSEYNALDETRARHHREVTSPERSIAQNIGELAFVLREATMGWAANVDSKSGLEFLAEASRENAELIAAAIEHGLSEIADAISGGLRFHAAVIGGPDADYPDERTPAPSWTAHPAPVLADSERAQ